MRLFIAIKFTEKFKEPLLRVQEDLRRCTKGGSFTLSENLHLTLAFIGESDEAGTIISVLDGLKTPPFKITLGETGRFDDLWWIGLEHCPSLISLAAEVRDGLKEAGIGFDKKRFTPHITIARRIQTRITGIRARKSSMTVNTVSLMRSDRIDGKLVYTTIYEKQLSSYRK